MPMLLMQRPIAITMTKDDYAYHGKAARTRTGGLHADQPTLEIQKETHMFNRTKFLLASTALLIGVSYATPSFSDTVTHETVTESSDGSVVKKTVTESAPDTTSVHTTVTETPDGTVVKKTVTETVPDPAPVRTTITTTDRPGTVTTETRWRTVDPDTGAHIVNLMDLDLNGDGILSRREVGEALFRLFDTDGNGVIDNIEYDRRIAINIMPAKKDVVITYDFDGSGKTEETKYTYETFMEGTRLARFGGNRDGLSPREFTGLSFLEADVNNDKAIDLKEWQGSYNASIDEANKDKARFNK